MASRRTHRCFDLSSEDEYSVQLEKMMEERLYLQKMEERLVLQKMEERLTFKQKKVIERLISTGPKDFKLLYSFRHDGADAKTFHQKCDNKGPTVTVIYNSKGSIYGGYIEKSWQSSREGHIKDDKAFLFRLAFDGKLTLNKFPVKTPSEAFYCNEAYGPVFGSLNDLHVFNGNITETDGLFTLNGNASFNKVYDMGGVSTNQITNAIKTVHDVEVYGLTESPKVWRESIGWNMKDLQDLKQYAMEFVPPDGLDIETANILVIGPVGAGKSSFFNTVASVFRGHISDQAVCGSAQQSITSKYRMYRVRCPEMGKPLRFCLCDTRGLEESLGIDNQELTYVLNGHVPDGYQFNPTIQISPDVHGFIQTPNLGNKIHCVCFVFDCNTVTVISETMQEKIKGLMSKVRQKDLPQAIVLTKIDQMCPNIEEDVANVYENDEIETLVNRVSDVFGVPRHLILPLKNYEKESYVKTEVSILALQTLKRLLLSAETHLFNVLDQQEQPKTIYLRPNPASTAKLNQGYFSTLG